MKLSARCNRMGQVERRELGDGREDDEDEHVEKKKKKRELKLHHTAM